MRAYPSAAYDAFSSLQHPTQSIPGKPTIASSMGKAKSPATPKTLVIPMSLSLDRTWSITVGDVAFCVGADSCNIPLVDTASFVGADTRDIIWTPWYWAFHVAGVLSALNEGRIMPIFFSRRPVEFEPA